MSSRAWNTQNTRRSGQNTQIGYYKSRSVPTDVPRAQMSFIYRQQMYGFRWWNQIEACACADGNSGA